MSSQPEPQRALPQLLRRLVRRCVLSIARFDARCSTALSLPTDANKAQPVAYWMARLLSHLGDLWLWGLIGALLWRRSQVDELSQRVFRGWFNSVATTVGATLLLKQCVRRSRPGTGRFLYGPGADMHSFPSGHASRMGANIIWSALVLPTPWLTVPFALAVAWSRVRLGIHFVGDVLVGLALGMCVGRWFRGKRE